MDFGGGVCELIGELARETVFGGGRGVGEVCGVRGGV